MYALPLPFLLGALAGIASLALLAGGAFLLWQQLRGPAADSAMLWSGAAMLLWSLLGRYPVLAVHPRGEELPPAMRGGPGKKIQAPDGSILQVEFDGPPGAPVIVLTHGWGMDSRAWQAVRRQLAQRYRLVLWDLPGMGRSRPPADGAYSVVRLAEDLRRVIDEAGPAPVTVAGHGIGGMMILSLCRLHPDLMVRKVNGIVLMNTTAGSPLRDAGGAGLLRLLRWPLLEPLLLLYGLLWPLAWLLCLLAYTSGLAHLAARLALFGAGVRRGPLDYAVRAGLRSKPSVLAKGVRAMLRHDESKTPARVPVASRVVSGDADRITPPSTGRRLSQRIPGADFVLIDAAGHLGLLQAPGRYADTIAQLADRVNRPPPPATTPAPEAPQE